MDWVTTVGVHLDRVASPWLISRFIDPHGTFSFIPRGEPVPPGSIGYAIVGSRFPPHQPSGSVFRMLMTEYAVVDQALNAMADAVEAAISIALDRPVPSPDAGHAVNCLARTLIALSQGSAVLCRDDVSNLTTSFPVYDSLYVDFWVRVGPASHMLPTSAGDRIAALKQVVWPVMLGRPFVDETAG